MQNKKFGKKTVGRDREGGYRNQSFFFFLLELRNECKIYSYSEPNDKKGGEGEEDRENQKRRIHIPKTGK